MKKFFVDLIKGWLGSLSNDTSGFSAKKMTALFATITGICSPMITYTYWAYIHNDWSLFPVLLGIITAFVAGLFAANIVDKMKNPTDSSKAPGTDAK